jgi:DNA polymerase-3 subunit delta'
MWYKVNEIMQSVIILGKDIQELQKKAQEIISENKISPFDIQTFESEKQIGIGDIRSIGEKIFLTTVKSRKKAVVLKAYNGMTIDAQNAFLKILEEPPLSTIIIILTLSLDFILPTILSRCNLINLEKSKKLSEDEYSKNLSILLSLKKDRVGNALILAQNYSKTKQMALNFLEGLILTTENLIQRNDKISDKDLAKMLKDFQKFYTIIKTTNVNTRFALENLLLNI